MKAVIPVAGAGTRLRPLTYTQPKPLIPVAGKPIIAYIIDQLVDAGIRDFVFIIGYLGEKIKNYLEENHPEINKEYVLQENREGLGHAIWSARDVLKKTDEIFIVLGDTIFDVNIKKMIDCPTSCIGVKKVINPRKFGVVERDNDRIVKVVEKPKIPKSNMAIVGLYKIKEVKHLMKALNDMVSQNHRTLGEFQLTDGLMSLLEQGIEITAFPVNNWYDCGKRDILLETNATLLNKKRKKDYSKKYPNSIIIPPVSIGKKCKIENSIIGPHVTIGDDTFIYHSIIKDSIIGSFTHIKDITLENSVIGSDAKLQSGGKSLNIGDNTEIDLS